MQTILIYLILNLIVGIVKSIGKKWNEELNLIWKEQLNWCIKHIWIPIVAEIIIILISLIFTTTLISIIL